MHPNANDPLPPFGPDYPKLGAGVQKHRRNAARAGGIASMSKAERRAYGEAVEQAILSLQRQAMQRVVAAPSANCASGTFHSDGDAIAAAVRGRQSRELAAACRRDREGRSDKTVRRLYDEAMAAKRNVPQLLDGFPEIPDFLRRSPALAEERAEVEW